MSGIEVLKDKCIGCSLCSKICPQGAIEMKDNKAEIGDACNLCGTCVAKCPVKAIVKAGATLDNLSEWDVSHLKDCRDVWVVTELRDGQIAGCTYELLGEARRLTVGTEHKVAAVLLCEEAGDYPGQLIAGGADIVYLMQDQVFHRFLDQPYKEAIVSLVKEEKPLALLLSDQCQHTTKIAVFNDESCTEFRDSKEFGGSIFKQFENSINYLALCNRTVSTIKGVVRTDKQDYPEEAIREALLNALVHRDYSFSGSIIINVNDSKMEFISLGGLLPGLSTEDIRLGVSQPRNKKLAEIFHRLRLIESYGTGIRRIFKLYASCPVQPSIEATTNAFRIVLPNMNAVSAGAEIAAESKPAAPVITPQMKIVLDYLKEYGEMRDEELQELLHIKKTRAYLLTRQMSEEGLIEVVGRGTEKKYKFKQ